MSNNKSKLSGWDIAPECPSVEACEMKEELLSEVVTNYKLIDRHIKIPKLPKEDYNHLITLSGEVKVIIDLNPESAKLFTEKELAFLQIRFNQVVNEVNKAGNVLWELRQEYWEIENKLEKDGREKE